MNKTFSIMLITCMLTLSTFAMDHFSVLAKLKILDLPFFDVWNAVNLTGEDKKDAFEKLKLESTFKREFAIKELIDSVDLTYKNGRKYISANKQLVKFLQDNNLSDDLLKTAIGNYKTRRFDIIGKITFAQLENKSFFNAWINERNAKNKEQLLVYLIEEINEKLQNKKINQDEFYHLKVELQLLLVETKDINDAIIAQIQKIIDDLNQ